MNSSYIDVDYDNTYECGECQNVYGAKKQLNRHLRNIHKIEPQIIQKNPKKLKCSACPKLFCNNFTLQRHLRNSHGARADHCYSKPKGNASRLICPQDNCFQSFVSFVKLNEHLNNKHSIEIKEELLEFETIEDFQKWKDVVQQQTLAFYTLDTATKHLSGNIQKQYLSCHRSYMYRPKGNNIRSLKSIGSNKTGKACPSRMILTIIPAEKQVEKAVKVQFWRTNCGHMFQLGHLTLNKKTRCEITGKLKEGVSFNNILDTIRDNEVNQRKLIIERKDLHNIVRDFHINCTTKRHANDAVSIKLWVEEMQMLEEECPILYYKGQDEDDLDTEFVKSDFVLIIMTSFQAEQLKKFGSEKICIDGTHGTNPYDINLFTIMTVDEFASECPVAYCFSNRSDETLFSFLFEKVKKKVGTIKTNVFMSDDASAFYNGWLSVMGSAEHKLLCIWHVDKNWRANLNKVSGGSEKKALVYKTLRVLMQITSTDEFQLSLNSVMTQLLEDDDTKHFGEYFQNYYAYRAESWAYCYRLGLGINTNMYLESFHKLLKHVYLEGRKIKRLDKTVDAVLKIARDSLFKRLIKLSKNSPSYKVQRINDSHKKSKDITSDKISVLHCDKEWLVTSSNGFTKYKVSYIEKQCSDLCLRCNICTICIHAFKCDCIDNIIRLNICKHIHACAQLVYTASNMNRIIEETCMNEVNKLCSVSLPQMNEISNKKYNQRLIKKAEFIIGLCSNAVSEDLSNKVEKKLDEAISLLNDSNRAVSLIELEKVNVQKKVEKQRRLYSTKKKNVKCINNLQKPSFNECNVIKDGLVNKINEVVNIHREFNHSYV